MKDLFSDPFASIVQPKARVGQKTSEFVETTWTDKRTGAEYRIKERVPTGPQGDFRVPEAQAESRYRAVMGIPENGFTERVDANEAFKDDRLPEESVVDQVALDKKIRQRALADTKRQQAFMMTNEPAEGLLEDRGDYTVDAKGQIRDKPYGTIGPFGAEKDRQAAPPSKLTREVVTEPAPKQQVASRPAERPKDLETRVGAAGLQVLLANAFRGLFGESVANNIMTRSTIDQKQTPERPMVVHAIMDAGLMKPWAPKEGPKTDRPQKPEALEYAVGARAMDQLMAQKSIPGLQDLPKAQRDDLTVAVGRTILNAMTLLPDAVGYKPAAESQREDLRVAIASAVKPDILKGLVPPEMLADRPTKDIEALARVHGASHAAPGASLMPERSGFEPERESFVETRATLGSFSEFGLARRFKRKAVFTMDDVRPEHIEHNYGAPGMSSEFVSR